MSFEQSSNKDQHRMLQSIEAHNPAQGTQPNAVCSQSGTTYLSPDTTSPFSPSKLLSTRPSTPPTTKPAKPPEVERHAVPWSRVHWARDWSRPMYSVNLGTGAVCVCVSSIPYAFGGQHALGSIFLIINILNLFLNIAMTCRRMTRHPKKFLASFFDESEGIWFPAFLLALCTIVLGSIVHGIPFCGPWLVEACHVAFWVYFVLAAAAGLVVQCTFRSVPRDLELIGPSECSLEVFPLMLVGTLGGFLAPHLANIDPSRALTVVLFSYVMQGLGLSMGYLKMSLWIQQHIILAKAPTKILLTYTLACGPPGFTAPALVNLGNASLEIFSQTNFLGGFDSGSMDPRLVAQIFFVVGVWWSVVVAVDGDLLLVVVHPLPLPHPCRTRDTMDWIRREVRHAGFISTCGRFGTYFPSRSFGVINIIFTTFVFCMWAFNLTGTLTLLWNGIVPGAPQPEEEDQRDPDAEKARGEKTRERRR